MPKIPSFDSKRLIISKYILVGITFVDLEPSKLKYGCISQMCKQNTDPK